MTEGNEVSSTLGVVAANPPEAARVGARILAQGGNAMDAASAASMACCMLQPMSTGVGGYVCCGVALEGESGRAWSVDANSIAPAAAHERMFEVLPPEEGKGPINEREYACTVKDNANVYGPLAVGAPGMMAGMGIVWERWGKLKWDEIVAPSLKLLADGFPYAAVAGAITSKEAIIRNFPATAQHLMPEGKLILRLVQVVGRMVRRNTDHDEVTRERGLGHGQHRLGGLVSLTQLKHGTRPEEGQL